MVLMLIVLREARQKLEGLFGDDIVDERKEEARVKYQLMPGLVAYIVAAFLGLLVAASRHQALPAHRDLPGHTDA